MKVLMINSFFSVGGPPRIMNGIYDLLIKQGHECKIASMRENEYASIDSIHIGNKTDEYINAIKTRLFDNEGFNAKKATQRLISEIKRYDPDIIHLHNLHGYYINIEILFDYLKSSGKPVVWTLHDCWSFTGHCVNFDYEGCEKWKTKCFECPQKKEYPKSLFVDGSNRNYLRKKDAFSGVTNMTIVTVSEWLKSVVLQSFLGQYDIKVIKNGIDADVFHPCENMREKYGLEGKKIFLGVAQNWGIKKGLNDFVSLSKKLDKNQMIVLIGLPKNKAKDLPANILTIPQTNNSQELARWYSTADIFLNLSYEETFGLVTVEAMACGTPVVVYDRTAVPEIVDENCGIIVKAGDIEGVLKAIRKIRKSDYTQQCTEQAKKFQNSVKYQEYIALYEKLLGTKQERK